MTNFDVELDGTVSVKQEFERLKDRWGGNATYVVGTNVEYAVFP